MMDYGLIIVKQNYDNKKLSGWKHLKTSRLFFEHLASEWDDRQPPERHNKLNSLLSRFDAFIQNADLVLEVGTGTGGLIPLLKKRFSKPEYIQIDFANAMLQRAQKNYNGVQLVQADAHELPFLNKTFSVVICHNSFPHFKEKMIALKEMRRVLKSGGTLLILHEQSREKVNYIHQHALAVEIHQDLLPDGKEIETLLIQSGFNQMIIEDHEDHYVVVAN
jgi:ubiquinone/menaquinone biosynthesis C-methylase UbiE